MSEERREKREEKRKKRESRREGECRTGTQTSHGHRVKCCVNAILSF
jgi:hypothetical protein